MMARVQGAIRIAKLIEVALNGAVKHSTYITGLLVSVTDGRLVQMTIPADLDHATIATVGFEDAGGNALAMVDPARLFVLIEPKHTQPLICNLTRKDGTTERHELPVLPTTPVEPNSESPNPT